MKAAAPAMSSSVMATDKMTHMAKERRTPSLSPAPKRWPMMTVRPEARPIVRPKRAMKSGAVAPTAARAWTPMKRPTMMTSAML